MLPHFSVFIFFLFKKNSTFVFRVSHTPGTSAGQGSRASASGPGPPASGRGVPPLRGARRLRPERRRERPHGPASNPGRGETPRGLHGANSSPRTHPDSPTAKRDPREGARLRRLKKQDGKPKAAPEETARRGPRRVRRAGAADAATVPGGAGSGFSALGPSTRIGHRPRLPVPCQLRSECSCHRADSPKPPNSGPGGSRSAAAPTAPTRPTLPRGRDGAHGHLRRLQTPAPVPSTVRPERDAGLQRLGHPCPLLQPSTRRRPGTHVGIIKASRTVYLRGTGGGVSELRVVI